MKWTACRRKPNWNGIGNSDHVVLAVSRVMTGERRAWRKEEVANEEIGTALRGGQLCRTQSWRGARSSFQGCRDSSLHGAVQEDFGRPPAVIRLFSKSRMREIRTYGSVVGPTR